jgi:hypothetical protein
VGLLVVEERVLIESGYGLLLEDAFMGLVALPQSCIVRDDLGGMIDAE